MRTLKSPEVHRSMGFRNNPTQQGILDTHIALAGAGGTANVFAIEAAHAGYQYYSIADPEDIDRVNGNRVLSVREDTIGRNKAEVLAEDILDINPEAQIQIYKEGITPENVEKFMYDAHVVLNAIELRAPHIAVMMARQARNRRMMGRRAGIPVMDIEYIGYAGQVTSFDPDGMSFERFMGIKGGEKADLADIAGQELNTSRYLAYLPPYGDLKTLLQVQKGAPLPSDMMGAGTAAQLGLAEMLKHVHARIGEKGLPPTFAPNVRWQDSYTGKSGETSHPQMSYYRHLAKVGFNNVLKRHEPASYTPEERAARGDLD